MFLAIVLVVETGESDGASGGRQRSTGSQPISTYQYQAPSAYPNQSNLDPWEQSQGPTATDAAQSISGLFGIQIELDREGLELQTTERRLARWVFQADDAIPEEVGIEWTLTADGNTFDIFRVKPVRPGPLLLLYFALVAL